MEFIAKLMYHRIPVDTWKLGKIVQVRVDDAITISCSCGDVQEQPNQIETTVLKNGVYDKNSVLRHGSLLIDLY